MRKVCQGGPEILFLGAGNEGKMELSDEAQRYLSQRAIRCEVLPTAEAAKTYNRSKQCKAALLHVRC